jgi:hypothetical protein
MTCKIKGKPLSDNKTESIVSLVEMQLADKQEQTSEPFNSIAVKCEFQEELHDITTVKQKLKVEEASKMSIGRHLMDAPKKRPWAELPLETTLSTIQ